MTEQFKIFILHGSSILIAVITDGRRADVLAEWSLPVGKRGLNLMSHYDFDGFRQISQAWWTFAQAGNLPWAGNI